MLPFFDFGNKNCEQKKNRDERAVVPGAQNNKSILLNRLLKASYLIIVT